jgi:hypothetical protein
MSAKEFWSHGFGWYFWMQCLCAMKKKMQILIWAKMTASSEFQVAFLSGTYYYTNVKPYFTFEWLELLSLPHTCHKPRSYCWRQNHILLYCNKQSLEFGISTCDKFILLAEKDLHLLQTKLLGWWAKDMERKGSPAIDWLTDISSDFLPS